LLEVDDGHRLAYDVAGQGLPAVVLHGGARRHADSAHRDGRLRRLVRAGLEV